MKAKPGHQKGSVILEMESSDDRLLNSAAREPFAIKNILVPIDFSECSVKALRYAVPLAHYHQADLTLIYVVPQGAHGYGEYGGFDYLAIESEMRANGKKELMNLRARAVPKDVHSHVEVRAGSPSEAIVELARQIPADLVIIATHGFSGLKHVLLGSVAERVVRHAPCPVLVVRDREHHSVQT